MCDIVALGFVFPNDDGKAGLGRFRQFQAGLGALIRACEMNSVELSKNAAQVSARGLSLLQVALRRRRATCAPKTKKVGFLAGNGGEFFIFRVEGVARS